MKINKIKNFLNEFFGFTDEEDIEIKTYLYWARGCFIIGFITLFSPVNVDISDYQLFDAVNSNKFYSALLFLSFGMLNYIIYNDKKKMADIKTTLIKNGIEEELIRF